MKAAIVSLSTLKKHDRWDVAYYLGNMTEREQAVARAQTQLAIAQTSLVNRTKELVDDVRRSQQLIKDGEVIPIDHGERVKHGD
jgi:hypothetical protein